MIANLLLFIRIAISAALYAFMGWAFWVLWRDLRAQARLVTAHQAPRISLHLAVDGGEETRHFVHTPIFIGRDPASECPINDPTVSTRHARLSYHHNQWWLEDLGSTNGTLLNGQPVTEAVVLTSSDLLRCGQVDLAVSIASDDTSQPASPALKAKTSL
jgi:hypothetical protein